MKCQKCLAKIRCEDCGEVITQIQVPIWKTIKLGTTKNLKKELEKAGINIGIYAKELLEKVEVSAKETTIDLVNISVRDLGFNGNATKNEIYTKAKELGLELCPAEVGPQLRLQYAEQPKNEWLFMGMDPIADSVGSPSVFSVAHDGDDRWLCGYWGRPGYLWRPGDLWFLALPRK